MRDLHDDIHAIYRSPRSYNRSPSNRSSNSSTDSGVAATGSSSGVVGNSSSCGVLPECQSSSSLQYLLGSHFNAGDSSGFLDDSRVSSSTWADPVSVSATPLGLPTTLNGAVMQHRGGVMSASASAAFPTSAAMTSSLSFPPQTLSTSMSFTLPHPAKMPKSSSSHAIAGPIKTALKSVPNYSSATLGRGLKSTFTSWTALRKKNSGGSQPELANECINGERRPSTSSVKSAIAETPSSSDAKRHSFDFKANAIGLSGAGKLSIGPGKTASTDGAGKFGTLKGGVKPTNVIELTEDLKPRRPLRPERDRSRPRSENVRDRGLSVSRLQTLKSLDAGEEGGLSPKLSRQHHSRSNPNLSQGFDVSTVDAADVNDDGPHAELAALRIDEDDAEAGVGVKKRTPRTPRSERPSTPSYKAFVGEMTRSDEEASSSGSGSGDERKTGAISATTPLKSVDIVM